MWKTILLLYIDLGVLSAVLQGHSWLAVIKVVHGFTVQCTRCTHSSVCSRLCSRHIEQRCRLADESLRKTSGCCISRRAHTRTQKTWNVNLWTKHHSRYLLYSFIIFFIHVFFTNWIYICWCSCQFPLFMLCVCFFVYTKVLFVISLCTEDGKFCKKKKQKLKLSMRIYTCVYIYI